MESEGSTNVMLLGRISYDVYMSVDKQEAHGL